MVETQNWLGIGNTIDECSRGTQGRGDKDWRMIVYFDQYLGCDDD